MVNIVKDKKGAKVVFNKRMDESDRWRLEENFDYYKEDLEADLEINELKMVLNKDSIEFSGFDAEADFDDYMKIMTLIEYIQRCTC